MSKLKTAHPLLSLSIESMTDQIVQRIKPTPIEEMYRLVCVLANDVLQNLYARVSTNNKDLKLLDTMAHNIRRVISSLQEGPIKQGFERDFSGVDNMDMVTYTSLLLKWRTKLFRLAKSRPAQVSLSRYSMFLMEFEYEKFENIDVPGQYAVLRDYNDDLVRIERFLPEVSLVCNEGSTISRCLSILGRNGRVYHFVVQNPSSRHSRREERAIQYFRTLNYESSRERSTINQRLMEFYFPVIVPLSHHIRLIQHDLALFTLQNVFSESPSGQEFDALSPRSIIMQYIEGMPKLVEELSNLEDAQIALFDR
ncbi:transcription-associated protein 1, partial [Spiromyces aspiralis]